MKRPFELLMTAILIIVFLAAGSARAEGCRPLQISLAPPVQLVPKEREVCGARLDLFWGDNKAVWGVDAGLANGAESIRGIEAGALFNRLKSSPESPATESWGLQMAGLVNSNARAGFAGIQAAGLVNDHDDASFIGIQLAGLVNDNDKAVYKGIQVALFSNQNYESEVTGLQVALFNQAKKFKGVQIGWGNGASAADGAVGTIGILSTPVLGPFGLALALFPLRESVHENAVNGVQLGVFNKAEKVAGMQIGIINVCKDLKGLQIGVANRVTSRGFSFVPIINFGF